LLEEDDGYVNSWFGRRDEDKKMFDRLLPAEGLAAKNVVGKTQRHFNLRSDARWLPTRRTR
jgi:hypothetical protein